MEAERLAGTRQAAGGKYPIFGTRAEWNSTAMSQQKDLLREMAAAHNSGIRDCISGWFTEDFRLNEPGAPALAAGHAAASQMRARFRTLLPALRVQDHQHSVVQLDTHLVGPDRDDREAAYPLTGWRAPVLQQFGRSQIER
jgi:hypothetical protein